MNYCPNCGQKMQGRFCSNCGFDSEAEIPQATPRESKKNKIVTAMQNGVAAIKQSKVGVFVAEHKKQSMIAAAALLIVIIATIVLIISLSNIFRVGKVSKIEIGMSTEEVIDILGEPHDKSESKWYYFERGFRKDYEKVTALLESEKEADWEKALELYEKLYEDSYKQIMVTFSDGKVTKVFLDKNHLYAEDDDYQTKNKEEIKELKLDVLAGVYEQKKADSEEIEFMLSDDACHPAYHIHYKDGSFFRGIMSPSYEVSENKTTIHYQWSNRLGEFTLSSPLTLLFKIDSDGTLSRWYINEKEVVLPDVIKALGEGAFGSMNKIKSLTLPKSVTAIPAGSLSGLSALKDLYLHKNITTINSATVTACKQLKFAEYENGLYLGAEENPYFYFIAIKNASKSATLHTSVQAFAVGALNGFEAELKDSEGWTVVIDGDLVVKHNGTDCVVLALSTSSRFDLDGITNVTFASSILDIPESFFYDNDHIISVTFPQGLTEIENSVFCECDSLTSIMIPSSVTSIGNYAFDGCSSLTTVTFGENSQLTSIGGVAFRECTSLTSITIPENVTSIGSSAFNNCTGLTEINFNATTLDSVRVACFSNAGQSSNGITVNVGANVTKIPEGLFADTSKDTPKIVGVVFAKNSQCTSIGKSAFRGCNSFSSITIPKNVTSIGSAAFENCAGLTEINFKAKAMDDLGYSNHVFSGAGKSGNGITVNIGSDVTRIPAHLFDGPEYPKIVSVVFEDNSQCTSVGFCAFYGSTRWLTSVYITDLAAWCNISFDDSGTIYSSTLRGATLYLNGNEISGDIVVPEEVTTIPISAFRGCDLITSITIPTSVTIIDASAFSGCNSLTTVYYGGSASDWNTLSSNIGSNNGDLTDATRYYYSATQPTVAGNWWYYDNDGKPAVWPAVEG